MRMVNGGKIYVAQNICATIVECLVYDGGTDHSLSMYEVAHDDGHHDIMVADNADCWLLGDENDEEGNLNPFAALADRHEVALPEALDAVADNDLRTWIRDRYAEADRYHVYIRREDGKHDYAGVAEMANASSYATIGEEGETVEIYYPLETPYASEPYDTCAIPKVELYSIYECDSDNLDYRRIDCEDYATSAEAAIVLSERVRHIVEHNATLEITVEDFIYAGEVNYDALDAAREKWIAEQLADIVYMGYFTDDGRDYEVRTVS